MTSKTEQSYMRLSKVASKDIKALYNNLINESLEQTIAVNSYSVNTTGL